MARLPRKLTVRPHHAVHKIWRGHNKEYNLGSDFEKNTYLKYLNDEFESDRFDVGATIEALTLMSNHTHEMFRVVNPEEFSGHMRRHHSRYGMFFNKLKKRSGKVAEDRPKTCLIQDEEHEMRAVFYIHANPLRANIVKDMRNYFYSTHRLYAFGKREAWMRNITLPAWYMRLGSTMSIRQRKYRQLFALYLKNEGGTRQNFLHKLFFGQQLWVLEQNKHLKAWRKAHRPSTSASSAKPPP